MRSKARCLLVAVLVLLATSRPGWAGEPTTKEPTTQELEDQAQAYADAGDAEGFERCTQAYLDLFNQEVEHPRADAWLWNAAQCSLASKAIGPTVQLWTRLVDVYPNSDLAQDALHALAELLAAVTDYEKSAERYELFAERYGKDARAPGALQNAYLFRLGLDQQDAAKQDLARYERLYQKQDPERAAAIFWSQHHLFDAWEEQREHALDYLKTYGKKGGIDRAIVAQAVVAQIDWRRSCRQPLLLDSCIAIERERGRAGTSKPSDRLPTRCGAPTHAIVTVHPRDAKLADEAQRGFRGILKSLSRSSGIEIPEYDVHRSTAFADAWGMAMFYQADAKYEEFLRIELPDKLDFSGAPSHPGYEASQRRLQEFLAEKQKLGGELQVEYAAIKQTGSPTWTLAAAARTASLLQNFADQLRRAKLPRKLRSEAQVRSYCDALAQVVEPIEKQALQAWEYCLDRSTEYQVFTPFSRACEAELAEREPERYPPTHELFGEASYASTRFESVGVLEDPG